MKKLTHRSENSYPSTFVGFAWQDAAYDAYAAVAGAVPLTAIVDGYDVDAHVDAAQAGVLGPSVLVA